MGNYFCVGDFVNLKFTVWSKKVSPNWVVR